MFIPTAIAIELAADRAAARRGAARGRLNLPNPLSALARVRTARRPALAAAPRRCATC